MTIFRIQSFIFMLWSVTAIIAFPTNCPEPESIWPCTCYDSSKDGDIKLYCTDETMTRDQLKNALNQLKENRIVNVELMDIDLGRVPSDFFQGIRIKTLYFTHCNIDTLNDGGGKSLQGLENTLEELKITSCFTEDNEPTNLVISHLRNLREFVLSSNIITTLGNDWFKNAPSTLRRVGINNNGIQKMGDRAFADVTNLEYLSLNGNRFGPIARSMLPNPANELDALELGNNALLSLPDDFFSNIPYLKQLSLANNGLKTLPENVWKSVWGKLDDIDLRGNPLLCDGHMNWMSKVTTCADIDAVCISPHRKFGETIPYVHDERCFYDGFPL